MSTIQAILAAVFDDAPLAEACQVCQANLAAYVEAEFDDKPAAALFSAVAEHLTTCDDCRQEAAELRWLLTMERQGLFEQPPAAGEFDFGYLQTGPFSEERSSRLAQIGPFFGERSNLDPTEVPQAPMPARQPWRLDAVGRLIIQFSADLLRSLQPPAFQPSYLKGAVPASLTYALVAEVKDLDVRIRVEPARRDPQRATVEVEVDIPSRGGWPNLAGSAVTLRRGAEDVLDRQQTDAFGKVVFEDVATEDVPTLVFEIGAV
jgi:hypothetical protein